MSWTAAEIEDQVEGPPRRGIALLQMLVKRSLDCQSRLQSFARDKTPERVVCWLLRFAERLGAMTEDGSSGKPPLTHQVISELRERPEKSYLRYSRQGIQVYSDALREHLQGHSRRGAEWNQRAEDRPRPAGDRPF
jgi:CRP-like cAMP-binding protein